MKHTITCLDDALEAAEQYSDLGLPVPVDVTAYLESQGIVTHGSVVDPDEVPLVDPYHYQQEV